RNRWRVASRAWFCPRFHPPHSRRRSLSKRFFAADGSWRTIRIPRSSHHSWIAPRASDADRLTAGPGRERKFSATTSVIPYVVWSPFRTVVISEPGTWTWRSESSGARHANPVVWPGSIATRMAYLLEHPIGDFLRISHFVSPFPRY